jgi:hypothetical protein
MEGLRVSMKTSVSIADVSVEIMMMEKLVE